MISEKCNPEIDWQCEICGANIAEPFVLGNAEQRNLQNPETFNIPSLEERQGLLPGDFAKLVFHLAMEDGHRFPPTERMWVQVNAISGGTYIGSLTNTPIFSSLLEFGDEVHFQACHVIDTARRELPLQSELGLDESLCGSCTEEGGQGDIAH